MKTNYREQDCRECSSCRFVATAHKTLVKYCTLGSSADSRDLDYEDFKRRLVIPRGICDDYESEERR